MAQLSINPIRLNGTLQELGKFGETPEGMQRLAFSPPDVASREFTMGLMRRAGLTVKIDAAGNVIGRIEGTDPALSAIAVGSHTDTVPSGGKYDGALGVMAGIECVQALADAQTRLRHPVEVLIFTNEEGTRFHRWLVGSRAMAGLLEPGDLIAVDDEGVSLTQRMADIGGNFSAVHQAARVSGELAAFFELHIEQGPTLQQSGTAIGVVTGITGRAMFEVVVNGDANHAGTTPMANRRDALVSASRVVLAVQELSRESEICRVSTVGSIQAQPNAVNVIPGTATLGVEFRDVEMSALAAAEEELQRVVDEIARSDNVEIQVNRQRFTDSVPIASHMQGLVEGAAGRAGLSWERLPSGAGHDAQAMASIAPMAMIFVPSVGGVSHSPREYTTPEACANGAQTLLELLVLADEQL